MIQTILSPCPWKAPCPVVDDLFPVKRPLPVAQPLPKTKQAHTIECNTTPSNPTRVLTPTLGSLLGEKPWSMNPTKRATKTRNRRTPLSFFILRQVMKRRPETNLPTTEPGGRLDRVIHAIDQLESRSPTDQKSQFRSKGLTTPISERYNDVEGGK